ncbi:MAG: hypothetical protein K0Q77_855 [Anaerosporomusa subterranea]|jgi:hypothetical protein|nr:hypothetical protein [Anaerosporomusa subterranea]MDF2500141.1 hypothetical protein [Anaerosporomusa subterranea]
MGGRTLDQFNSRQKAKAKDSKATNKQDAMSTTNQSTTRDKERI